jgi:hypothetical protein
MFGRIFGLDGRESYREPRLEPLAGPHRLSRGTAPHEREYPRRDPLGHHVQAAHLARLPAPADRRDLVERCTIRVSNAIAPSAKRIPAAAY